MCIISSSGTSLRIVAFLSISMLSSFLELVWDEFCYCKGFKNGSSGLEYYD